MKITVVYGGRGLIEDPTLYVLEKMQMVMEELRVDVERINLYEEKNQISTLPAKLKNSDGLILGVSLEWFGIGGYMQQFLDACWLYGDKDKMQTIYMMPVVLATTSGEKDAMLSLVKAWEVLGGIPANGLCAYVENPVDFELNKEYGKIIEKKAEHLYRTINQSISVLPSSSVVIRTKVLKPHSLELTPQESEQLSKFVSNDTYVKQQKEDIEELAAMFKGMLGDDKPRKISGNDIFDEKDSVQTDAQDALQGLSMPTRRNSIFGEEPEEEKNEFKESRRIDLAREIKREVREARAVINELPDRVEETQSERLQERVEEVKPEIEPDRVEEIKPDIKEESIEEVKPEIKPDRVEEIKPDIKEESIEEVKPEIKPDITEEIKPDIKEESIEEVKPEIKPDIKEESIEEVKPDKPTYDVEKQQPENLVEKAEERPSQNIIEKAEQTQPEKVQEQPKKRVSFQEKVRTQTIPRDFQDRFRQNFHSEIQVSAVYTINITDQERILRIAVDSGKLDVSYTSDESADVIIRLSSGVLNRITMGEMNFQRTFMSGDMKFKGDFKTLRALDQIFHFS